MKESRFQARLVKALRRVGAVILNLNPDEKMGIGWPDLYIAHPEWSGWIELKVKDGRLSPRQEQRIRQLRKALVSVAILRLDKDDKTILLEDESQNYWVRLTTLGAVEAGPLSLLHALPINGEDGLDVLIRDDDGDPL